MSIHADHRQRMKQRFVREGLDHFDDLYILELLLFYCIPRRDTNEIAHNLLNHFGNLPRVLEAAPDELKRVTGVGEGVATFIMLLQQVSRAYEIRRLEDVTEIKSGEDIKKLMKAHMRGLRNETVYLLCADSKWKVLCVEEVGKGSVNSANVSVRKIVEIALASKATTVILGHNHPGGLANPSAEDIAATEYIAKSLRAVDIQLADHVIVSEGECISLYESGLFRPNPMV